MDRLLKLLQRNHLAGLAGARAAVRLPIDERLLNQLIAESRPEEWPIRELTVELLDRDELIVRVRPKAALMPTIQVRVSIEQQPDLPASPLLILRIASNPLTAMALAAVRSKVDFPQGVRLEDDRIRIDLQTVASRFGLEQWLPLLTRLRINTKPHLLVLEIEAAVPLLPDHS